MYAVNKITLAIVCFYNMALWWPSVEPYPNDFCENDYVFRVNSVHSDQVAAAGNDIEMPVLANGHIAFVPNGDSIYMNGVYNGFMGETHRARIPNFAHIRFEPCGWYRTNLTHHHHHQHQNQQQNVQKNAAPLWTHTLDIRQAVFTSQTDFVNGQFTIKQTLYAHRYFDRAIVNQVTIRRNTVDTNEKGSHQFEIKLYQMVNASSVDLSPATIEPVTILGHYYQLFRWTTQIIEEPLYVNATQEVFVLQEIIPETIQLDAEETMQSFVWFTFVGRSRYEVLFEANKVLSNADNILDLHKNEWYTFWNKSTICIEGHNELSKVVHASLFAIAASLPSLNASQARHPFYSLSPQGLGKGGPYIREGYRGHSFWDTEIWMQPSILLLEPNWSRELLYYRYLMRKAAADNAHNTGYKGLRYPWESALTGRDVTWAEYPEIVEYQQHITADIGFAIRKHIFATHDTDLLQQFGCELATGTATFWASRVAYNKSTDRFDINGIMGPDEDHYNINNNAYTNVVAAMNLHFGSYANCICNQLCPSIYPSTVTNWSDIGSSIKLLYDIEKNYNPQYDGYTMGTKIKQADVVLLAYPLQYRMDRALKRNNLNIYANVTRDSGPAMTWSMHALGHLDIGDVPSETMFNRTFVPYIRKPFYTWNEYMNGVKDGAENFITGAGGFLQLIMYGYTGIRLNADALIISGSQLPPQTTKMILNGISYLQSRFRMEILPDLIRISFYSNRTNVRIYVDGIEQTKLEQIEFELGHDQTMQLKSKIQWFDTCLLPKDDVNQPFSLAEPDKDVILIH